MKKQISIMISIIIIILIGTVYGVVTASSQKGELNGDGAINYADVSLLEAHLIHQKSLGENMTEEEAKKVLKNADMNNDGEITVTDLSILIQKIENKLNYEVTIRELEANNYYPQKMKR